jgi:hypothetical protein
MRRDFCSLITSKSRNAWKEEASKRNMYSPKIRDDLIPRIYREAKKAGVKMTVWVNAVIELALRKIDEAENDHKERRKEIVNDRK